MRLYSFVDASHTIMFVGYYVSRSLLLVFEPRELKILFI